MPFGKVRKTLDRKLLGFSVLQLILQKDAPVGAPRGQTAVAVSFRFGAMQKQAKSKPTSELCEGSQGPDAFECSPWFRAIAVGASGWADCSCRGSRFTRGTQNTRELSSGGWAPVV